MPNLRLSHRQEHMAENLELREGGRMNLRQYKIPQLKFAPPFYYCTEYKMACALCGHQGYESEFVHWGYNLVRTPGGVAPTIDSIDCPFCGAKEETSLGIRIENFLFVTEGLFDGQEPQATTHGDIPKSSIPST
jgi:hypothetical protein